MNHRFVFIGAGNLATHLSVEFKRQGFQIIQVYSRSEASASRLAQKLHTDYTTRAEQITQHGDIYFVALKDSAFDEVLSGMDIGHKLLVHCSGSMPLSALDFYAEKTGVFYPLQTFSRERQVSFGEIPVFIESRSEANQQLLLQIARKITSNVAVLDSEKRLNLHIAAVFACNFVNHFYALAAGILQSKEISFDVLKPLIMETAKKVQDMDPREAQTGPAVRFDQNIINKHMQSLEIFPESRELYEIVSKSIYACHQKEGVMPARDIEEDFKKVKAFVFDVDGVLSRDISPLSENGDPVRTSNVKDGFAIRMALKAGYPVAVITGGYLDRLRLRYEKLGVKYYYDRVQNKEECLSVFLKKTGLKATDVLFMGDDMVDYLVMKKVGLAVCPADAAEDIKSISRYISTRRGGEGCVREVIEKTLRARNAWFSEDMYLNKVI